MKRHVDSRVRSCAIVPAAYPLRASALVLRGHVPVIIYPSELFHHEIMISSMGDAVACYDLLAFS